MPYSNMVVVIKALSSFNPQQAVGPVMSSPDLNSRGQFTFQRYFFHTITEGLPQGLNFSIGAHLPNGQETVVGVHRYLGQAYCPQQLGIEVTIIPAQAVDRQHHHIAGFQVPRWVSRPRGWTEPKEFLGRQVVQLN